MAKCVNGTILRPKQGIVVEPLVQKGSELPDDDVRNTLKYRVVFQGNNVVDQNWEAALFQVFGSSPASTEAGKAVTSYGTDQA